MMRVTRLGIVASLGPFAVLVGCSGNAEMDGSVGTSGGSGGSGGTATTLTAGAGGKLGSAGASPGGGSGGQGGHAAGAGGSSNVAGAGGSVSTAGAGGSSDPGKNCGGFLGDTCSASEYCAYMPGQACGAADASSTCQPRPNACPDIYMPVCGCDGKTYSSTCDAAASGQGVMSLSACSGGTN